jgi:type VI secretion system protein VasD
MKLTLLQGFLALIITVVAGCGSKPPASPPRPPPPTQIIAEIKVAADLNLDPSGRPSPLLIRLYELKTPSAFGSADFFSLYEKDNAVLGTDLLGREEIIVKPGENQLIERTLNEQTRYLGFIAAYRDLDQAVWRSIVPVTPHLITPIKIDLRRNAIEARVESF